MNERLVIIDGTALLFRMYFAGIEFNSPDGVEVGGVLGSTQTIKKIIQQLQPKYVAAVFDAGAITFRHDIFAEYKANRGPPPEDLRPQFDLLYDATEALGIRCFRIKNYEADDIMVSLAKKSVDAGIPVQMVTNDKDVAQVIQDGEVSIHQVLYFKKEEWGEQEVYDKFGIHPTQVVDYLAMIGDSVDNIKGINGVGPKSAQVLLNTYKDLDEIYDNIDAIPSLKVRGAKSLQRKLIQGKNAVYLAQRLIQLKTDMDLNIDDIRTDLFYSGPTGDDIEVYQKLGFSQPFRDLQKYAHKQNI
jgi:DNA polymerase I